MTDRRRWFPARRTSSAIPGRRRRSVEHRPAKQGGGAGSLVAESLEPRALLAVTATLVGADLQISLGAADDVAYLSNDGTNYIVRGTGLSGYAAALATVNSVAVAGTAAANQSFSVAAGVAAVLVDPLTVAASVENTTVAGAVDTTGGVVIDSPAITLAANVTTTGQQRYKGAVGLVGERTLSAGAGDVLFESTVDSSPAVFADPDAFGNGTNLTSAYPGITLSDAGTASGGSAVTSDRSLVSTPTTGDYAPTGNRVFSTPANGNSSWNAPSNVFKAAFTAPVISVSLDFAPNDNDDPNAFIEAYDSSGTKVASATYAPAIPELSSVTLTVAAPKIAYILASFDLGGINTGLLDNLRATYATTPAASLTANSSAATTFASAVGGLAPLASLTTNLGGTVSLKSVTTTGAQKYGDDATLDGTYTTTNSGFSVGGATTLAGPVAIDTGAGAGDISFAGTLDGGQTLALTAGTGNVSFSGLVGNVAPLAAITINSATNVTANGIRATSLTQAAGSGTTTLNSGAFTSAPAGTEAVRTSGAAGVSLSGTNLAVNAAIVTANGGPVSFSESGTITIAAAGDISADGPVSMKAGGGITTAGDVTTTNDTVTYSSATTLAGPVAIDTGAGAGDISFASTLDGGQTLALTAGTGTILFNAAVGTTSPLAGLTVKSASSTTAASTIKLDGASKLASDGLTIAAGVNNISFANPGSLIRNFTGQGVVFVGGSTGSTMSGFTVSDNGDNGARVGSGDYSTTKLEGNQFFRNGRHGLALDAAGGSVTNLLVTSNWFDSNVRNGVLIGSDLGTASSYAGSVVRGNDITRNGANGVKFASKGATKLDFAANFVGTRGSNLAFDGGNVTHGVRVNAGEYAGTTIRENYVAYNNSDGLRLAPPSNSSIGRVTDLTVVGNTFTNNDSDGIQANSGLYSGTVIRANKILANKSDGIFLSGSFTAVGAVTKLTIGGDATLSPAPGNEIASNAFAGIQADAGSYSGTAIQGNAISRNGAHGIALNAGGGSLSNLLIGGGAVSLGNAVTLNGHNGIFTSTGNLAGTTIAANSIRDNGDSTLRAGNGILVQGSNVMIGWADQAGEPNAVANTITGNAVNGIEIRGTGAKNNAILSNSIYRNGYVAPASGARSVVGEGIAVTSGAQSDVAAPVILRAVRDAVSNVIRVAYAVPSSGSYYVQFFDNTPVDERGVFPVDTQGFEGRTLVGDDPAQASSAVASGRKPAILGVLVQGTNALNVVEIPADRIPPGNWITSTATKVDGTTPTSTSAFSAGFQRGNAPVLAVGGDGPSTWAASYPFQAASQTSLVISGVSLGTLTALASLADTDIVVSPADATGGGGVQSFPNVIRRVLRGELSTDQTFVTLTLAPGEDLPTPTGTFVIGSTTLPTARLYDTSAVTTLAWTASGPGATQVVLAGDQRAGLYIGQSVMMQPLARTRDVRDVQLVDGKTVVTLTQAVDGPAGSLSFNDGVLLEVGAEKITSALQAAGVAASQINAFVNRFQGGLRVAHADLNGDGYADLATAPGGVPSSLSSTLGPLFGDAARVITIYDGASGGTSFASINVTADFPANYTGGFFVTLANVRPENAGSGDAVAELVVASTGRIAVYNVTVPTRGGLPSIVPSPIATYDFPASGTGDLRVTGVTSGDFSGDAADEIVVATTTNVSGDVAPLAADASRTTAYVQCFTVGSGQLTATSTFAIKSMIQNGPPGSGYGANVFYNGASLAAGDVDGIVTTAAGPQLRPELVLGASFMGLGNFRVLANDLVRTGNQAGIDSALTLGNAFTQQSRPQLTPPKWQPTGGPDYFVGRSVPESTALGANSPLAVAVVDGDGRLTTGTSRTAHAEVFAAIGATNQTANVIRRMGWNGTTWFADDMGQIQARPTPTDNVLTAKTRFPLGYGLRLG
ncbi:MAG: beta strand repeat-containing protein [Planctomycetaceae bacterium]